MKNIIKLGGRKEKDDDREKAAGCWLKAIKQDGKRWDGRTRWPLDDLQPGDDDDGDVDSDVL